VDIALVIHILEVRNRRAPIQSAGHRLEGQEQSEDGLENLHESVTTRQDSGLA
jgi:hypothetical protein